MVDDIEYPEDVIGPLSAHIEEIIKILGDDTSREGLLKTPRRAAKALWYATQGYRLTPEQAVGDAVFRSPGRGIVTVRDIEYYSFCEHHMLPFFGRVSIGYLPGADMLGLSKLARLVNLYARRLQVQERLTRQVCDAVQRMSHADGVMVVCTGEHLCMKMRGVEKESSSTVTIATTGAFDSDASLRAEFMASLRV